MMYNNSSRKSKDALFGVLAFCLYLIPSMKGLIKMSEKYPTDYKDRFFDVNSIDKKYFDKYNVKRGLRNADGTGVMAGVTKICNVHGYVIDDGEKTSDYGKLTYRGYSIKDLVEAKDKCPNENQCRGFEEVAYLLLMGELPNEKQLSEFSQTLSERRLLPGFLFEDTILKSPSKNVMNKLASTILMLYSFDENADIISAEHEIETAVDIISRLPNIMISAYQVMRKTFFGESMIMHPIITGQSTSEFILSMLRNDRKFTHDEARLLDIMLMLHADHGGGNNSTFTCRVMTSSGTDPYSAYAAAIGSLKGPKHGGANKKVTGMHKDIIKHVKNIRDEGEVADYLTKILKKEAYDGSGLVYGMGHAVYTLSDPRAEIVKKYAGKMAMGTEFEDNFKLLEIIERITPELFAKVKGSDKAICANIDMYSGFVYEMLGIPQDLFTPLFAVARMAGWCAHRFEEIIAGGRIIRPAYKSVFKDRTYIPLKDRK